MAKHADAKAPFPPAAHGGYKYVSKSTDHISKWTVVYLLRSKNQELTSLQVYVTSTVILFSRIVRANKGGKYTGKEFNDYCSKTGIKLEFSATNTLHQIGVSKHVGKTFCALVPCLLVDSVLSFALSRWELMLKAEYLCNRRSHLALQIETPHTVLCGRGARLSHLKTIGARVFVHIKDHTKLGYTFWEGMVCSFSERESTSYHCGTPKSVVQWKLETWSSS